MSADELPADMEAIEWRIQQDMDDVSDVWRHCRIAFVDAADPDDVVGFPSFTKTDLRALLKAYQEQRRALEEAAKYLCRLEGALLADDLDMRLNFPGEPSPTAMAERILPGFDSIEYDLARAALNQKGDER